MKIEVIKRGDIVDTNEGYLLLKEESNGGYYIFEEYVFTELDNFTYEGIRILNIKEVERIAKDVDGRNHKYIIQM